MLTDKKHLLSIFFSLLYPFPVEKKGMLDSSKECKKQALIFLIRITSPADLAMSVYLSVWNLRSRKL